MSEKTTNNLQKIWISFLLLIYFAISSTTAFADLPNCPSDVVDGSSGVSNNPSVCENARTSDGASICVIADEDPRHECAVYDVQPTEEGGCEIFFDCGPVTGQDEESCPDGQTRNTAGACLCNNTGAAPTSDANDPCPAPANNPPSCPSTLVPGINPNTGEPACVCRGSQLPPPGGDPNNCRRINCDPPQYYDLDTRACEDCPYGYNELLARCNPRPQCQENASLVESINPPGAYCVCDPGFQISTTGDCVASDTPQNDDDPNTCMSDDPSFQPFPPPPNLDQMFVFGDLRVMGARESLEENSDLITIARSGQCASGVVNPGSICTYPSGRAPEEHQHVAFLCAENDGGAVDTSQDEMVNKSAKVTSETESGNQIEIGVGMYVELSGGVEVPIINSGGTATDRFSGFVGGTVQTITRTTAEGDYRVQLPRSLAHLNLICPANSGSQDVETPFGCVDSDERTFRFAGEMFCKLTAEKELEGIFALKATLETEARVKIKLFGNGGETGASTRTEYTYSRGTTFIGIAEAESSISVEPGQSVKDTLEVCRQRSVNWNPDHGLFQERITSLAGGVKVPPDPDLGEPCRSSTECNGPLPSPFDDGGGFGWACVERYEGAPYKTCQVLCTSPFCKCGFRHGTDPARNCSLEAGLECRVYREECTNIGTNSASPADYRCLPILPPGASDPYPLSCRN